MLKEQKMLKRIKALIEIKENGIIDEVEFEKRKRNILDEKSLWKKMWTDGGELEEILGKDEKTTGKKDDISLIIISFIIIVFVLIIIFAIVSFTAK